MGYAILILLGGLVLLVVGAELLVRGAVRIATALRVPALVVGLTVVAYGTSTPELAVSVDAALRAQPDISLGNVVGSNTFNVLFILGLSALITPLVVAKRLVRLDVPIMIAASVLTWILALGGRVGRVEGLLLLAGVALYTAFLFIEGRREAARESPDEPAGPTPVDGPWRRYGLPALLIAAGLVVLAIGSRWMVDGAVRAAHLFGVSELVIAITIVGAGTSLPELATSVVAAVRGQRDIAVGNIVGSNVFNILGVLGASAALSADGVAVAPVARQLDIPVMVLVAVACFPVFFTQGRIPRWEGGLFLVYYVAYVSYLIVLPLRPEMAGRVGAVVWWVAVPATFIGLAGTSAVSLWKGRRPQRSCGG